MGVHHDAQCLQAHLDRRLHEDQARALGISHEPQSEGSTVLLVEAGGVLYPAGGLDESLRPRLVRMRRGLCLRKTLSRPPPPTPMNVASKQGACVHLHACMKTSAGMPVSLQNTGHHELPAPYNYNYNPKP